MQLQRGGGGGGMQECTYALRDSCRIQLDRFPPGKLDLVSKCIQEAQNDFYF